MKSVIVFYCPIILGATDAEIKKRDAILKQNLQDVNGSTLANDCHIVIIQDPSRSKVETEVFFKPE